MDAVIVILGYEGGGDPEFRIKEVAIVGLCRLFFGHWIIERPPQFANKDCFERVVTPLEDQDLHKIAWHEGSVSMEKLKREITRLDFKDHRLYTPNEKHTVFIEKLTGIQPVLLKDYVLPDLQSLFDKYGSLHHCIVHTQKGVEEEDSNCAVYIASAYRKWLRANCSPGRNIFIGEDTFGEEIYKNLRRKFKKPTPAARVPTDVSFSPGSRNDPPSARVPTDNLFLPGSRDEVG